MDGNRRWAQERGLPTLVGHKRGYDKVFEVAEWCREAGIETLIVYAFSLENFKRSQEEVSYLMDLFRKMSGDLLKNALENKTRVQFIGDRSKLPKDIQIEMKRVEEATAELGEFSLVVALAYDGRDEIVRAVNRLNKNKVSEVGVDDIGKSLDTSNFPDPDLLLRTSGEQRISGFLLWQSSYAELAFSRTYWPGLEKNEFFKILEEVECRDRRFGK